MYVNMLKITHDNSVWIRSPNPSKNVEIIVGWVFETQERKNWPCKITPQRTPATLEDLNPAKMDKGQLCSVRRFGHRTVRSQMSQTCALRTIWPPTALQSNPLKEQSWHLSIFTMFLQCVVLFYWPEGEEDGRAASGGALAPELPRATGVRPLSQGFLPPFWAFIFEVAVLSPIFSLFSEIRLHCPISAWEGIGAKKDDIRGCASL